MAFSSSASVPVVCEYFSRKSPRAETTDCGEWGRAFTSQSQPEGFCYCCFLTSSWAMNGEWELFGWFGLFLPEDWVISVSTTPLQSPFICRTKKIICPGPQGFVLVFHRCHQVLKVNDWRGKEFWSLVQGCHVHSSITFRAVSGRRTMAEKSERSCYLHGRPGKSEKKPEKTDSSMACP